PAGGRNQIRAPRRPGGRRHPPGLGQAGGARAISRGLVLPPQRGEPTGASAARARRRHHHPGAALSEPLQPGVEPGEAGARVLLRSGSMLLSYPWPGNVRELENAVERAVLLAEGDLIVPQNLPERIWSLPDAPSEGAPLLKAPTDPSQLSLKR